MSDVLRIGNASGFYGDRFDAFAEMLAGGGLDVLTGDYLAELTMGILARDRMADPSTGYAKTFLRQMEASLAGAIGQGTAIVVNAGGLNPAGLASALTALADRLDVPGVRIGLVTGDSIDRPGAVAANAYLGAFGIAECLRGGANVVITGRVTDASLVVGPAIARFGWTRDDLDALAGASVAGHVLECGTQATGGNYAFFTEIADLRHPGFPIAEIASDGSATITKHPGTGGAVTRGTVTAQLLYEIGDPAYPGPDVIAHFDTIRLAETGPDRVTISGVTGSAPPETLKVGVVRLGGVRNTMTFVLTGLDIEAKAALVTAQLSARFDDLRFELSRTDRPDAETTEAASALLRVHSSQGRAFSSAAVELALASYPGATLTTAPGEASPYAVFTAETVRQSDIAHVAIRPDGRSVPIPAPEITAPVGAPGRATGAASVATAVASPVTTPVASAVATPVTAPVATPDATRDAGLRPTSGPMVRRPLGTLIGARSGDKGGDANIGLWARTDAAYAWMRHTLTTDKIRELLPETADLPIDRYELPNLRAVNVVIGGVLGMGAGGSTRFDPQAKALGELLRSRYVDIPESLI